MRAIKQFDLNQNQNEIVSTSNASYSKNLQLEF